MRKLNLSPKRNILAILTHPQARDVVSMIDASCCNSVDNYFSQVQLLNNLNIYNDLYFHLIDISMFEKHAKKGRLVYVAGKLQTRRWKKDEEDSDRFSTEILLAPGGRIQFLDKVNGNGNGNGAHPEAVAASAGVAGEDIPF